MKIAKAAEIFFSYHRNHSKKNTVRAYETILSKFCQDFGEKELNEVFPDKILRFLNGITEGTKQQTKRTRYAHMTAFFNFITNNIDRDYQNSCNSNVLKKMFRANTTVHWDILEKETVDEIIFSTTKPRNRLMLELMARGEMRVGEVLKLKPEDINDHKLKLRDPKSDKEPEFIFTPQKIADRLKEYIRVENIKAGKRIFPICYEAARAVVKKAGNVVVYLRPHDLRRHAATYASRCGIPIDIVSKIILLY